MMRLKNLLLAGALLPVFAAPSIAAGVPRADVPAATGLVLVQAEPECGPGTGVKCKKNDGAGAEDKLKKRKADGNDGGKKNEGKKNEGRKKADDAAKEKKPAKEAKPAKDEPRKEAAPVGNQDPSGRANDRNDTSVPDVLRKKKAEQDKKAEEERRAEQRREEQRKDEKKKEDARKDEERKAKQRADDERKSNDRKAADRKDDDARDGGRKDQAGRDTKVDAEKRKRVEKLRDQREERRKKVAAQRDREREKDRQETLRDVRQERRERRENGVVYIDEGDGRVIVTNRNGDVVIRNDESRRIREYSRDVEVNRLPGGREETIVYRDDGTQVITVRDSYGRVIERSRIVNGRRYVLFYNDPAFYDRPDDFIVRLPPPPIDIPRDRYIVEADTAPPELIYDTFAAPPVAPVERRYPLDQVVNSPDLLQRVRRVDIDSVTFETGSWKVDENQIDALDSIAASVLQLLEKNPDEVFLVEGHTDAVGEDIDNLTLSDRRAEEVAYLLTEYYDVPPESLTTKGYGESDLKVPTQGPSRENRRVTMRRITALLQTAGAQ